MSNKLIPDKGIFKYRMKIIQMDNDTLLRELTNPHVMPHYKCAAEEEWKIRKRELEDEFNT